jgi:hypothetical protein
MGIATLQTAVMPAALADRAAMLKESGGGVEQMESGEEERRRDGAVCPMHAMQMPQRVLAPHHELVFPMHKRVILQYGTNESGLPELRLYYGDKEITFDEPELFGFGETLAKQSRFVAGTATTWSEGYDWPRMQQLLEQLLEEGILHHADSDEPDRIATTDGARPSPLPPAIATGPRTWFESEAITRELTGRSLEPGYLELVIPVFRVAHIALDLEGRQVGEANVFPKALRLDVPTNWRTCIYPGSRYQVERPMNVTALKSMRAHWPQMMAALLRIRQAYLERFPEASRGWTVGHLERLATLVLAVPTYVLMRSVRPVENGNLHPALSSMFRVTDGLRMTMHQMLFVPIGEPALPPEAPMSSNEIFAYAERNFSFYSDHGVCAGPKAMIEEFLSVLVDGKPVTDAEAAVLDEPVQTALDALDAAIDYGLRGLQAYAAAFSLWPVMARTYDRLWTIVENWSGQGSPNLTAFRERLRGRIDSMRAATYLGTEELRVGRERVYEDMYRQCAAGLRTTRPDESLAAKIAPQRRPEHAHVEHRLRTTILGQFGGANVTVLDDLVNCLMNYLVQEQAIVRVACESQKHINILLGRTAPARPFNAALLDIHNLLQAVQARRLPHLDDELEEILGIRIVVDPDMIQITDGSTAVDHPTDSEGIGPSD